MKGLHAFAALWLLCSGLSAAEQNATVLFGEQQPSASERQGVSLEAYLSDLKRKAFGYDYAKTEEESAKLRDSWIQPAVISYTLNRQNPYNGQGAPETQQESASIAIDQPIFRSGGIYYGIKYAEASRDVGMLTIAQQERTLIKQAVDLLMQIKQSELGIAKQKLQVDNTEINLLQKREQYMSGQLDSGFLNNAIIERNVAKQALLDLQTAQERLVSAFESISDLDYRTATIPFLAMVDEARFMDGTIDLALAKRQRAQERYNKDVTLASYLPSISVQGSYNWQKQESFFFTGSTAIKSQPPETAYYRYGVKASMPIDINSVNDYEASRLAYLKAKVTIDDTKRALRALYEQVVDNLRNIDAKIALAKENEALYATLLQDTEAQYGAGLKTQYDVELLANSRRIEQLSQRGYEIDRQRELLNLYEKLSDPEQ
ncbi:TolC family protein [Sulfurimonas sp. HSL1-2]|uniref:TolC family protein n=1 Tax=Thiomicrolovo zhangzhouensis TaxID=3131933 RepID=UPI0031F94B94